MLSLKNKKGGIIVGLDIYTGTLTLYHLNQSTCNTYLSKITSVSTKRFGIFPVLRTPGKILLFVSSLMFQTKSFPEEKRIVK